MKVLTAELVASNRREKISGGVYIEFETTENVKKGDYFKVRVGNDNYDFKATGIKVIGEKLMITAKEVGYWAWKLEDKPEIQNIILWDDSMDVYGVWDKMPNWKELLVAYRKTIWFSKSLEDKRDQLLRTIL
jgi:hypothetical protein